MFSSSLSRSLVVADGVARKMWELGSLPRSGTLMDVDAVAAGIARHPNLAARRRAELVSSIARPLAESVGESYSRAAFQYLGFEQPILQHEFTDADGFAGRSDFWWPEERVVGEFDGRGKYLDARTRDGATAEEVVYREKLREDRIRNLGYGFVRWGWADVDNSDRLRNKLLGVGLKPRHSP